ncbi:hypothetical protein RCC89_16885 [Cytophagaceae bacterium ABcell3]|nr:hypothetical protein RCC89_16885 [Cytophagaceae bacterium ABcell3]
MRNLLFFLAVFMFFDTNVHADNEDSFKGRRGFGQSPNPTGTLGRSETGFSSSAFGRSQNPSNKGFSVFGMPPAMPSVPMDADPPAIPVGAPGYSMFFVLAGLGIGCYFIRKKADTAHVNNR